ncbi:acyltransferase family protein [Actibacterium sp. D379-3]
MNFPVPSNASRFIEFRPDIDGMRAIAVLSVVVFHMGFSVFSGGYVGVDVFFVISGYLITQDIVNRIAQGRFSLVEFYMRRVRRIFPALFVVLSVSVVAALLILLPSELTRFAKSLIGASMSVSNIVFYRRDSYFGVTSEESPLLHTWSLGVEEQFYLLWPILLILVIRSIGSRYLLPVMAAVILISLVASQALLDTNPTFSFYMLPTRAWELAIGGVLSALVNAKPWLNRYFAGAIVGMGLGALSYSVFFYTSLTRFPGLSALVPCLGAVAIIYGGQFENPISSIIASRPMTFIGRLSYPLYLVHWPIIVFWELASPREIGLATQILQIVLMFLAAYLILIFVEPPFRRRSATKSKLIFWGTVALVPVIATGFLAVALIKTGGPTSAPGHARLDPPSQRRESRVSRQSMPDARWSPAR